jgi:hypothetical protein
MMNYQHSSTRQRLDSAYRVIRSLDHLRRQITIAHDDVVAIRDDLDRTRRFVLKSHSAGLLEIEFSRRLATVWTDLHQIAGKALQGGDIIAGSIHEGALRSIVLNGFGGRMGIGRPAASVGIGDTGRAAWLRLFGTGCRRVPWAAANTGAHHAASH